MLVSERRKFSLNKDKGLGQEGLVLNRGNAWSQKGAEIWV